MDRCVRDVLQGGAEALLDWYDRNARALPWRATRDPYRIMVSEFMLQQTQVATVIPYYEQFLRRFPTLLELSRATEEEVLEAWKGLGYYRRAKNLHKAVQAVAAEHGGRIPEDAGELIRLPGVGEYTAAAVASIAFGRPVPVVDGNVLRVMTRVLKEERPIDRSAVKRRIREALEGALPEGRPGDFNQAMMELGATVCTPTSPQCGACPLAGCCAARAEGLEEQLPARSPKGKARLERRTAGIVRNAGSVLMARRPPDGLLGGMWEFPNVEGAGEDGIAALTAWTRAHAGCTPGRWRRLGRVEHRFSHLHWVVEVAAAEVTPDAVSERGPGEGVTVEWVALEDVEAKALPKAMHKVWEQATRRSP